MLGQHQHDDAKHLAINNHFPRRWLTLLALKTTSRFYRHSTCIFPISKQYLVKTGPHIHLTEAATMKFVAEHTSLPVPKVYCSFLHKNRAYIVMERIQGEEIHSAWSKLDEQSKNSLLAQLKQAFAQLRALKPPQNVSGVQSCVDGSLRDCRIPHCQSRFGPFETVQDFHLWLRQGHRLSEIKEKQDNDDWRQILDMAVKQDGSWPAPVFTHGDLNPGNILVRGGKIVGIIDWEFAGWYPHYWEYTSAWYGNRLTAFWQKALDQVLESFPEELKMEIVRQKWWGDF